MSVCVCIICMYKCGKLPSWRLNDGLWNLQWLAIRASLTARSSSVRPSSNFYKWAVWVCVCKWRRMGMGGGNRFWPGLASFFGRSHLLASRKKNTEKWMDDASQLSDTANEMDRQQMMMTRNLHNVLLTFDNTNCNERTWTFYYRLINIIYHFYCKIVNDNIKWNSSSFFLSFCTRRSYAEIDRLFRQMNKPLATHSISSLSLIGGLIHIHSLTQRSSSHTHFLVP